MLFFPPPTKIGRRTAAALLLAFFLAACMAGAPDWQRVSLPALTIPAPTAAADRRYLGLEPGTAQFTLDQVTGKLVVLEFILAQCPHCQREAPKMKRFYELVQERGLGDQIKFVGIALGNTPLETGLFKERYQTPFPLIPNPGRYVMKVEATPTLYFLRPGPGGESRILYQATGHLPGEEKLLQQAIELGGLSSS